MHDFANLANLKIFILEKRSALSKRQDGKRRGRIPGADSLSRIRKVPVVFPGDFSSRSASFRVTGPKFHLENETVMCDKLDARFLTQHNNLT